MSATAGITWAAPGAVKCARTSERTANRLAASRIADRSCTSRGRTGSATGSALIGIIANTQSGHVKPSTGGPNRAQFRPKPSTKFFA